MYSVGGEREIVVGNRNDSRNFPKHCELPHKKCDAKIGCAQQNGCCDKSGKLRNYPFVKVLAVNT